MWPSEKISSPQDYLGQVTLTPTCERRDHARGLLTNRRIPDRDKKKTTTQPVVITII